MAATRLSNVIVPDVWNPYMIEQTAAQSALFQSGIISPVTDLQAFVAEGGNTINMPFWQDLSGDDEVLSATGAPLTVNAIQAAQDIAVVLARGKAWGVNELAAQLSGGDPAGAIASRVGAYWSRQFQAATIAILKGVFESLGDESPSVNVLDISIGSGDAGKISGDSMLDAQQQLGDAKSRLTAVAMHSATENALAKQNLIEYIRPSEGSPRVPFYQDKRVIVDDSIPYEDVSGVGRVYDTYLFGPGAIGYAEGTSSKVTMTETDRDALRGEDILITRRHFVLHPRGVKWATASTGGGPANNAASPVPGLSDGDNWVRVYEPKNIRMVLLRHRI